MHQRLDQFLDQQKCSYILQLDLTYSTNNALTSIIENVQSSLDFEKYTGGVFIDF